MKNREKYIIFLEQSDVMLYGNIVIVMCGKAATLSWSIQLTIVNICTVFLYN